MSWSGCGKSWASKKRSPPLNPPQRGGSLAARTGLKRRRLGPGTPVYGGAVRGIRQWVHFSLGASFGFRKLYELNLPD